MAKISNVEAFVENAYSGKIAYFASVCTVIKIRIKHLVLNTLTAMFIYRLKCKFISDNSSKRVCELFSVLKKC